ncbi:MAG TPA: hypothetical protein VKB95_05320 [Chitinophagaceae bacterium]|nr:hypothetical protein [Chitinophagaceae bacterium]
MQTIEIRRNKKALTIMLILLAAVWIGLNYYVYVLKGLKTNMELNILNIVLTAILVYAIYMGANRLKSNEPVLIFTKTDLTINIKGNPESFLWLQITEWEIGREEDDYLLIKTADEKRKISLAWLEKNPGEIRELMIEYSRK